MRALTTQLALAQARRDRRPSTRPVVAGEVIATTTDRATVTVAGQTYTASTLGSPVAVNTGDTVGVQWGSAVPRIASVWAAGAAPPAGMPAGVIVEWGGYISFTPAPDGWLECDGSAVSRTTYADLFDAIGTDHGSGDGSTTFNLPSASGYIIKT